MTGYVCTAVAAISTDSDQPNNKQWLEWLKRFMMATITTSLLLSIRQNKLLIRKIYGNCALLIDHPLKLLFLIQQLAHCKIPSHGLIPAASSGEHNKGCTSWGILAVKPKPGLTFITAPKNILTGCITVKMWKPDCLGLQTAAKDYETALRIIVTDLPQLEDIFITACIRTPVIQPTHYSHSWHLEITTGALNHTISISAPAPSHRWSE